MGRLAVVSASDHCRSGPRAEVGPFGLPLRGSRQSPAALCACTPTRNSRRALRRVTSRIRTSHNSQAGGRSLPCERRERCCGVGTSLSYCGRNRRKAWKGLTSHAAPGDRNINGWGCPLATAAPTQTLLSGSPWPTKWAGCNSVWVLLMRRGPAEESKRAGPGAGAGLRCLGGLRRREGAPGSAADRAAEMEMETVGYTPSS